MNFDVRDDTTHQVEPVRQNYFNILLNTLKQAERRTYVHRLIYIGEHTFPGTKHANLEDAVKQTINIINSNYNDEHLSGVLLYYTKYFCHVLEGSEDSIIKHLILLTEDEEQKKYLGRMKMLVCYHHINQRFTSEWISVTGKPPTLLERLDAEQLDLNKSYRHVFNCIQKIYKLAQSLTPEDLDVVDMNCLPEYGLLEFLLTSKYTINLYDFINIYGVIPIKDGVKDLIWPTPSAFVPYHIFDEPVDAVTDLPIVGTTQEGQAESVFEQ